MKKLTNNTISSKSVVGNVWKQTPSLIKVAIVVVGALITYKVVKKIISNTKLDPQTRDSKQQEQAAYEQYIIENRKTPATLNEYQMKSLANTIFNLMDGYGTRDAGLIAEFKKIKNNADFLGVDKAYGIRQLQPGHGVGWLVSSFKGTMTESIRNEAADDTIKQINKYLQSKNIKYKV